MDVIFVMPRAMVRMTLNFVLALHHMAAGKTDCGQHVHFQCFDKIFLVLFASFSWSIIPGQLYVRKFATLFDQPWV